MFLFYVCSSFVFFVFFFFSSRRRHTRSKRVWSSDVCSSDLEMLTNPNADPQSAYVKEKMIVQVDSATLFNDSAKEDLQTGREVQMVGLDLKNGMIQAARLTV